MIKVLNFITLGFLSFASVGSFINAGEIKVGATPLPHAKILEQIVPDLKKEGVDLKIVTFTDYVMPNLSLEDKSIDANFMQHLPYLEKINKDKNLHLTSIAQIHIEPIGAYSKKIKDIKDLPEKAVVAIPADTSNGARALILLHNNGIITLQDPKNLSSTKSNIKKNPKKIEIKLVEAALLTKALDDVDLAVINGNFAMQIGLSSKDALLLEDSRSPYANILAVRKGDESKEDIVKLKNALQSQKVKDYINNTYHGEILPVF